MTSGKSFDWTYRFWHSPTAVPPYQDSGYAGADEVLDRLRQALLDSDVRAAVADLRQRFHEDVPAAFLAWPETTRAVDARFDIGDPSNPRHLRQPVALAGGATRSRPRGETDHLAVRAAHRHGGGPAARRSTGWSRCSRCAGARSSRSGGATRPWPSRSPPGSGCISTTTCACSPRSAWRLAERSSRRGSRCASSGITSSIFRSSARSRCSTERAVFARPARSARSGLTIPESDRQHGRQDFYVAPPHIDTDALPTTTIAVPTVSGRIDDPAGSSPRSRSRSSGGRWTASGSGPRATRC